MSAQELFAKFYKGEGLVPQAKVVGLKPADAKALICGECDCDSRD
jgi:hypothetical protein